MPLIGTTVPFLFLDRRLNTTHRGDSIVLRWRKFAFCPAAHICTGTGLTPATSAPGPGLIPATSAPGSGLQQLREIALGFMRRERLITVQEVHKFMRDSGLVQAAPSGLVLTRTTRYPRNSTRL